MWPQKYNVLSMYKKKFMQFKTKAFSFRFFLAECRSAGNGRLTACNRAAACAAASGLRPSTGLVAGVFFFQLV